MSDIDECCSVCFRRVGINTGDDGTPPVDLGRCAAPGGFECRAVGQAVVGYRHENEVLRSNSDHLLAAYSASVSEADRLRKLFDDAGQGEHNVLALIDHYQRNSMDADERLRAVRVLLEENGCDCPCDHHPDERGADCDMCLACRIGEAVGK